MFGFTENYVKVTAKYDPVLVNEMKKIRLTGINSEGIAEIEEAETEQLIHK